MGIFTWWRGSSQDSGEEGFPRDVVDSEEEGQVYVLLYGPEDPAKHGHYGVLIDVAGESTGEQLVGLRLFLERDQAGILSMGSERAVLRKSQSEFFPVGQISPTTKTGQANRGHWASELVNSVYATFQQFKQATGPDNWEDGQASCQLLSQGIVASFGLVWPETIEPQEGYCKHVLVERKFYSTRP